MKYGGPTRISNRTHPTQRYLVIASIGVVVVTAVAVWLAFALLRPTPPHSVVMAIDPEGSFSADVAKRYRELLGRDGIDLRLAPSAGAVESAALLQDAKSGVSAAIVPSGITNQHDSPDLISLGTVYFEPLWGFSRGRVLGKHEDLQGLRISIGPDRSATHALSSEFLARVGIINQKSALLLSLTPQDTARKLLAGEIDGAILMDAWETPLVRELLTAKDVHLDGVPRADAFVALYPFLNKLTLPAGVADMRENRPPHDVTLLATKASLVVRKDLHPAIQYLLLEAATQVHSGSGLFHTAGQFPAPESIDLPLGTHARQFYKTGPPFLQRHFPFWVAVLVQQLLVLLIPVLGVVYPIFRLSPAVYGWVQNRRIYKLYSELILLEAEMTSSNPPKKDEDFTKRLDELDQRARRLSLPISYRPLLYALRMHIDVVRERIRKSIAR
jgi:TRAP-type uncharacterized transport system substrate-binding protein